MQIKFKQINSNDAEAEKAKKLEYEVFYECKYIEENELKRVFQYDRYPDYKFLGAYFEEELIGVVRIISDKELIDKKIKLPSICDFEIAEFFNNYIMNLNKEEIIEIGVFAIREDFRGGNLSLKIMGEIVKNCWSNGERYSLNALDERFLKVLLRLKLPIIQIGEEKIYMGSKTYPTILNSNKLTKKHKESFGIT